MSSTTRSLRIRVTCPVCKRPGIVKIKIVKKKYKYVIIDHNDTEHSLGPLSKNIDWLREKVMESFQEILRQ